MTKNSMARLHPLRDYIRQNVADLRSSPCLLISSAPPPPGGTSAQQDDPRVRAFVERNEQHLALEFNLRAVTCRVSSAFPTSTSLDEAVSLAKRAGLKGAGGEGRGGGPPGQGVIVGMGSGAAMDLAKAVADAMFGNISTREGGDGNDDDDGTDPAAGSASLVLAPCTIGGVWAASSNSSISLLDTKEEMLLPYLPPPWRNNLAPARRNGTVVTMDPYMYLAMPPLYTPFLPVKRSEYTRAPTMAHVAAAALAIMLDLARTLDAVANAGRENNAVDIHNHVAKEIKDVTSLFTSVLELATCVAKNVGGDDGADYAKLAQRHLLDAIPRLSSVVERSSFLANVPLTTAGTLPQKLANSLLPTYFPQCHLITFLASTLPGLCDLLSESLPVDGNGSMVGVVATSITEHGDAIDAVRMSSLSSWASRVTMEAGLPSMASLAYGTPDVNTLVGKLDSYEALMASFSGGVTHGRVRDDQWLMEDVLRRSLLR
ncbi:hypothetical protein ACHAW5_002757 [Stephanodiscus triporus]|uniref:Uncharacterized protein n=1 Tax=Stephanodiscus triporus TaxID=2934178 RepID=A0ABD3NJN9_9STRA